MPQNLLDQAYNHFGDFANKAQSAVTSKYNDAMAYLDSMPKVKQQLANAGIGGLAGLIGSNLLRSNPSTGNNIVDTLAGAVAAQYVDPYSYLKQRMEPTARAADTIASVAAPTRTIQRERKVPKSWPQAITSLGMTGSGTGLGAYGGYRLGTWAGGGKNRLIGKILGATGAFSGAMTGMRTGGALANALTGYNPEDKIIEHIPL